MPKHLIKRYMPDHEKIREHKHLKIFGTLLHSPNLWHLNRRSAAGAFAVGLFCAAVPVPFQMMLAAAGAILFSVNLPISVALVWVTNPLTMGPMFFIAYEVGSWVLGREAEAFEFQLTWDWLSQQLGVIWEPFLLGCLIFGIAGSLLGYLAIRLLWRLHVVQAWQRRKERRNGASDRV